MEKYNMQYGNRFPKFKKGFGILEVMVSAMIIIMILAALVFISHAAINNSVYTQQRAQATYLAQEGIEQVRQIRDTNWIDGSSATQWEMLQWNNTRVALVTVFPLAAPPTDFYIVYGVGAAMSRRLGLFSVAPTPTAITINQTAYTRKVNIFAVGSLLPNDPANLPTTDVNAVSNALKITVTVTWDSVVGNGKSISVSEVITNWRPNY